MSTKETKPSNSGELELRIKGHVLRPLADKFVELVDERHVLPTSVKQATKITEKYIDEAWKRVEKLVAEYASQKALEAYEDVQNHTGKGLKVWSTSSEYWSLDEIIAALKQEGEG